MAKKLSIALNVVCAGVLLAVIAGQAPAAGAKTKVFTIPAAAMAERAESEHNDGNALVPDACDLPTEITKADMVGEENRGMLTNGAGSYVSPVALPQGAKLTSLSLFAVDNDADQNVHAYLVRTTIGADIAMPLEGYEVMAETASNGAVATVLRQFTDDTISPNKIDNVNSLYFVELVVCPATDPYAIQIAYKK